MKIIVQRCESANVEVDKKMVGKINNGFVLLVSFTYGDNSAIIDYMISKILNLRIFDDEDNVMNKSILDIKGDILSISQFTLYANTSRGNRPSYASALKSSEAKILYDEFNEKLLFNSNLKVETGNFGCDMKLELINDGPVTIILEREVE